MNEAQVAVLLALANGHDQRHDTSDVKVQAWFSLLLQEAPDMDLDWAVQKVNAHYAKTTDMLMPAHLVASWKHHKTYQRDRRLLRASTGTPMPEWFKKQMREIGYGNGGV